MELDIYNIHPSWQLGHLHEIISYVLSRSSPGQTSVFQVSINPRAQAGRCRSGRVIFPTRDIGQQFIWEIGGWSKGRAMLTLQGSGWWRLFFRERARSGTLNPQPVQIQREVEDEVMAHSIHLSTVQFGWECRDKVYSVEYKKTCRQFGLMTFQDQKKRFCVRIGQTGDGKDLNIIIRASQIVWASAGPNDDSSTAIFMSLTHSPTYQREIPKSQPRTASRKRPAPEQVRDKELKRPYARRKTPRITRLSALDDEHTAYTAYTSTLR